MGVYRLNRKLVAPTLLSLQRIPVTISDSIIRTELLSARRIIAKLDTHKDRPRRQFREVRCRRLTGAVHPLQHRPWTSKFVIF